MAFVLADRVKETTTSPGTGTATLNGAATGYQSFSAGIGANNTTYYTIADQSGSNWEVGYGTVGAGGTTLARTTVLASSNSGSLVNFASGTQDVWCDYPAKKAVITDSAGALRVDSNPYVNFEDGTGTAVAAGRMWYNNTDGSWNLGMGGGNITQQVGEEIFVYGKASSAISGNTIAQCIYQTGTVGASGVIQFAPTVAGITDGNLIQGIATEDIALNGFGRVTSFGVVHGIDTSGSTYGQTWADGDTLWYNPVGGGLTNVKPSAPNIKVSVGTIIKAGSGGSGSIQVEVNHGSVLGGTDSNVQLTSVANGNILTYDGGNSYWKNTDLTAGTGISVSKSTNGVLTVANTGVTSVSGTAPISSSGGATPAISISQATTSTNGYLSSTDWNTFNNKQPAGAYLTAVTADSPLTGSGTSASHLSIPAANGTTNGYLTSTDWTTFNNKGSGTVTSVTGTSPVASSGGTTPAISLASGYGDTQNPYASKTANYVLAAPNGIAGVPTFRALVAADIPSLSYVSSVSGTAPISSSGGTTPAISISQATTSTNGYLSSTDWNTFNNKAPSVTYTSNQIPYGQGTTTPLLSSNFTYNGTVFGVTSTNATNTITVTDTGTSGANIKLAGNGATTPNKTIRAFNGNLAVVNNAYSSEIFTLTDSGALTTSGTVTANGVLLTGNTGTVTSASVVSANGFAGSVATATTTPAITISTSVTGVLKGNGTAISAATAGTDYSAGTSALGTGILKSTTGTGALSIAVAADFPTLNQNTTGSAGKVANALTAGTGITFSSGTTYDGSAAITISSSGGTSPIPAGTVMLFYQSAAPTGWTQVTTVNDVALRLVSGTGGTTGGTTAFSTVFTNQTPTITTTGLSAGATTLSTTQIPSHNHTFYGGQGSCGTNPFNVSSPAGIGNTTSNTGGGGSHSHAISGSATSSAITLNVAYANIILCSKN